MSDERTLTDQQKTQSDWNKEILASYMEHTGADFGFLMACFPDGRVYESHQAEGEFKGDEYAYLVISMLVGSLLQKVPEGANLTHPTPFGTVTIDRSTARADLVNTGPSMPVITMPDAPPDEQYGLPDE